MVHRVREMTRVLGRDVDAVAVARARRLAEGFLDSGVRRARIAIVISEIVARVRPHEKVAWRDERAGTHGLEQIIDDDVVPRVCVGRDRRQRQYAPRGIEADAPAEIRSARPRLAVEIAVELRRPGNVDFVELVAMKLVRLAPHRGIPDDQPVEAANRKQLVRQIVPAEVHGHRPHAPASGHSKEGNLRENQAWRADRDQCRPVSSEDAVGARIGNETIGQIVPPAAIAARRKSATNQRFHPLVSERGPRGTGSPLDPKRLGRPRFEVPRLNESEEPAFHAHRDMGRQRLKGHARAGELGRKRRIVDERRHQNDPCVADVVEHARQHACAQHITCAAAVGNRPQQARAGRRLRHRAGAPLSARSTMVQSSGSSMFSPYGGDILYAATLSPYKLGSIGSNSTAVRNK